MNDDIYNALKSAGVTPASKNYADLVAATGTLSTNKYNAGYSAGNSAGYNAGAAATENRIIGQLYVTYASVNVAVGQVWLICRTLGAGGKEGYCGDINNRFSGSDATCAYTVLTDVGKTSDWTTCWAQIVQITAAGILAVKSSMACGIK